MLSYLLDSNHWGYGYALECCRAVFQYAYHALDIDNIVAVIDKENVRSLRTAILQMVFSAIYCNTITAFIEQRVACDSFALERCCLQLTSSPRDAHPRGAFFTL